MFYRWLLPVLLCTSNALYAAITLKGDSAAASNETFSFRIQNAAISTSPNLDGTNLYVAAHPSDGGSDIVKEFAVSLVSRDTTSFLPLAPQKITFNSSKDVANPLYDKGIAFFSLFNAEETILAGAKERPIVVLEEDKTTLYMINSFTSKGKNIEVISFHKSNVPTNQILVTNNVPDAAAAVTSGIVQITNANPFTFAAVAPNAGSFGDVGGSGIALSIIGQVGNFTGPLIVDAPTGSLQRATGNRALALDISSTELKIGSDLASIGTIVDMVWHKSIGRLYIALQTTGGAAGTDGTRSIVIGRIENDTKSLSLEPIAPTTAIDGTDKIIGAVGSSVAVTAHKVREMFSSTALPYLIVLGNVGAPSATQKSVFALPLVSGNSSVELNGTIAAKNAVPEDLFFATNNLFLNRVIKQPATTTAQMPLSTDIATRVGGGAILNGDITDLFVSGDTVFATVQGADIGQIQGVFYSQSLFESNGKIKGWTIWRRAVGLSDRTQSVFLDPITGQFYTLTANSSLEVKTVKRTEWGKGDPNSLFPLTEEVGAFLAQPEAGVQGIHDFVVTSAALGTATPGLLDISLLVVTGYKKVLLAQTSRIVSGAVFLIQNGDFGPLLSFDEGTITQTFPTSGSRVVGISGGVLDDIGPIVAAEIAKDGSAGSNGWLFVGGSGGVAVLSKEDGSGWDTASALADGLTGLESGMSFKKVGDFAQVRKLINDDQYLYVITNNEIVRIDLTLETPGLGSISAATIATSASVPQLGDGSTFLDAIVSEKLMLIGTDAGFFRLADGLDARTVDSNSAAWQLLATPEGVGPVRQLFAISQTGRAQDIAREVGGGTLYTLSAYRGKNQGQLHRFDVAQVTTSSIDDTTVRRVNDLFVENIASYFASFGLFRNVFATDGSLFYGTRSKMQENSSQATVLNSKVGIHSGSRFLNNLLIPAGLADSTLIAGMIQNSATGTWLIAGDHGLRANE